MTPREIKAEARRALTQQTLLPLILSTLCILATGFGWLLCVDGFFALLDYELFVAIWPTLMDVLRSLLYLLGWLLLLSPLASGMRTIAGAALDGASVEIGTLFCAFASIRSMARAWASLWPFRRGFWRTLGFRLSFLPWFALGLLSGGVLFVLFVIPYFTLADVLHQRLIRPLPQSEKEINHV